MWSFNALYRVIFSYNIRKYKRETNKYNKIRQTYMRNLIAAYRNYAKSPKFEHFSVSVDSFISFCPLRCLGLGYNG